MISKDLDFQKSPDAQYIFLRLKEKSEKYNMIQRIPKLPC